MSAIPVRRQFSSLPSKKHGNRFRKLLALSYEPIKRDMYDPMERSISSQSSAGRLVDVFAQPAAAIGMAQLSQRFRFDLANAFACDTKQLTDFFQRALTAIV
jgi:hypothetical protein